ncbi:YhcG family protein [Acaryochloris sp. 'Moss Beach']|uniref:PDDEXK nuclease domain-containing protein n=1 Tax=Acaryochloris sp. 'Moss Beach' TaxID=2740837 RepID=UPI001F414C5D|nr:PDDEXK nuclease domain-containing protein [Acaryochloris sp. 'Moss Beach']
MSQGPLVLPPDYGDWLASLKQRIQSARSRAVLAAHSEQIRLYHSIGCDILERQRQQGWGAKVINRLSTDLREAFPEMKGLSVSNLKYMRRFAEECPNLQIGQQLADQFPWFHVVTLLTKVADPTVREWYAVQALDEGWSRSTLEKQIKNHLHDRQGAALTNFEQRLTQPQADLAVQVLKDPYHFDFLGLGDEAQERDIEGALVRHITHFLLELGGRVCVCGPSGAAGGGGGDEFFIDLLFYHTRLKCYVVVELKATAFKPEHAGQLNFYLSAVDAQMKAEDDLPTIGLLLCKTKNQLVAEYALSGMEKPMGVAEYELVRALPEPLDRSLPSIEEIEAELSRELEGEI